MPMSMLSNGRYTIALTENSSDTTLADRLRRFLHPYFHSTSGNASHDVDLHLSINDATAFQTAWIDACTQPLTIRDTTAVGFTLRVHTKPIDENGVWFAWDRELHVGYRIDHAHHSVDFYGEKNAFIHLIELVRYYGLLVEQAKGTAIMHASAVVSRADGSIIAIGGVKGAGKTTTMLDLVQSGDYLYFSGDKLLLDVVDGKVRARGWPDYPHVGVGTLRSHPMLAERLGLGALASDPAVADTEKTLCAPEAMRAALQGADEGSGWLSTVMLPKVSAPGALRTHLLDRTAIEDGMLTPGLFEWPHQFITSTWHGLLDPVAAGLSDTLPATLTQALGEVVWQSRMGIARQSLAA